MPLSKASKPDSRFIRHVRRILPEQDAEIAAAEEEMRSDPAYAYDASALPTVSRPVCPGFWILQSARKTEHFLPTLTYVKSALHDR